jgi:hypothetical protein
MLNAPAWCDDESYSIRVFAAFTHPNDEDELRENFNDFMEHTITTLLIVGEVNFDTIIRFFEDDRSKAVAYVIKYLASVGAVMDKILAMNSQGAIHADVNPTLLVTSSWNKYFEIMKGPEDDILYGEMKWLLKKLGYKFNAKLHKAVVNLLAEPVKIYYESALKAATIMSDA